MYNGIGLPTARGSGTNGYVGRNLSAIRKTKEKIKEQVSEDAAVRPYDPSLVEHERRRQIEVKCLELREMLEEQEVPDDEIEEQIATFRAKLNEERKDAIVRDSSGRPMVKDSHELAMAQEAKNERAKNAFGIRDDFIPGSSLESNREPEKVTEKVVEKVKTAKVKDLETVTLDENDLLLAKALKKKKKKRTPSSSSSSSSSSGSSSGSSSSSSSSSGSSSSSDSSSDSSDSSSGSEDGEVKSSKKRSKKTSKVSPKRSRKDDEKTEKRKKRDRSNTRSNSGEKNDRNKRDRGDRDRGDRERSDRDRQRNR